MGVKIWLGILLAIVGSTNLNVGKAIQKWKVRVWGHWPHVFAREHRKDMIIWCLGTCLTASATVLYSLALQHTYKSSTVSALTGIGIIGLVLFAHYVIKERVGRQELWGAALVLAGTGVMGIFAKDPEPQQFSVPGFTSSAIVMLGIVVVGAVVSWRTRKFFGVAWGALPGVILGIAVILGDMALVAADNSFTGQLKTPYPYIAMGGGLVAIVVTQMAFWRARALVVVPTVNSMMIVTPVILEYFTFGFSLKLGAYVGVLIIVFGVVLLGATEAQGRIGGGSPGAVRIEK